MPRLALDDLQGMLREQRRLLTAHEVGARLGTDPENVHQMRTATRRLRAILRAVRDSLDPAPTRVLRELRWLGRVLGAARDLDVLRQHLRAELAALEGADAAAITGVLGHLDAERRHAQAGVRSALLSGRYEKLSALLDQALGPALDGDDVPLGRIARRRFKRLRKAVQELPATPSDEQLHAVRVRVKRARYAGELARDIVGRPAKRFVREAGKVQDILGEHQDAAVAEAWLRRQLRADRVPPAVVRRLLALEQHRRRSAWIDFQDRWPKLEKRGRKAWD
jgi:CHAD domain-containing protein